MLRLYRGHARVALGTTTVVMAYFRLHPHQDVPRKVKAACSRWEDGEGFWLVGALSLARLLLSLADRIWATHSACPELSLALLFLIRLSHPSITYQTCISIHGQKSRSLNIDFVFIQRESHVPLLFHLNCAEKNLKTALKVDAFPKDNDGWYLLNISVASDILFSSHRDRKAWKFLRLLQHLRGLTKENPKISRIMCA